MCKNVCEMRDGDKIWHMLYPVVSAASLRERERRLSRFYRTGLRFCLYKPPKFKSFILNYSLFSTFLPVKPVTDALVPSCF